VIFNQRQLQAVSQSATIKADSYPVGTDYGGIVTDQYVQQGDSVSAGEVLFQVQSLQLERDIKTGAVAATRADIANDGTITIRASVDGIISDVTVEQGGFAQAGSVLANINRSGSLFVEAKFVLSPRDFGRISDNASVTLRLPDQSTITGTVESLGVQTMSGSAETIAHVVSDELVAGDENGLVQPGTPIEATLELRDDGPLAGVGDASKDFLHKIGL
jgi:multidrug resistance efflux pump